VAADNHCGHNFGNHRQEEEQHGHCGENVVASKPVTDKHYENSKEDQFDCHFCFHTFVESKAACGPLRRIEHLPTT
jgi:hypothetical protein